MGAFHVRLVTILAVAIAFATCAQAASASTTQGSLSEIGCWQQTGSSATCTHQEGGLRQPVDVAVSPDGKNVYMLSSTDEAIDEFARGSDGSLTALTPSCIADPNVSAGTCPNVTATGIAQPAAIAISPDGKNVYVAGADHQGVGDVAEFARDPSTGVLTQLSVPNDCIAENTTSGPPTSDCTNRSGHGIDQPVAIAISPDGQNVYVADRDSSAIATLTRSPNGSLSQPNGANDCISEGNLNNDCTTTNARGLSSIISVVVSPDGRNVYAGNGTNPGAIAEFARNANGSLTQLSGSNACIEQSGNDCPGNENGVGIDNVAGLAVSPDGQNLYVAADNGRLSDVAEFARNADGSLSQLGGSNNCIEETGAGIGCNSSGTGLNGARKLKVSPDGASVYVTTLSDDCCAADVAEFSSNPDGSLAQLPPPDNCIEETGASGECAPNEADELGGSFNGVGLDVASDGKTVYATGFDGLAELARVPVTRTLTVSRSGPGSGSVSDGNGGISCPSTCSHAYTAASRITLTATPSPGSFFAGWSGGGCSGTGACQVTLTRDTAVTATFNLAHAPLVTAGKPTVHGSNGAAFSGSANPNGALTRAFFQYGLDRRYTNPGSSGPSYTTSTTSTVLGSGTSNVPVSASVSGLLPNALYHVRLVAINSQGTTFGPDQTFTTLHGPAPPPPTLGKFFNAGPVSGVVYLVLGNKLIPLTENTKIPVGAILDTLHGQLLLTSASGGVTLASDARSKKAKKPKTFKGTFGGAVFQLTQTKSGPNKGQTTLTLVEGRAGVPSYKSCKARRSADSAHTALSSRVLSRLRSRASGRYRTRGRYAAGTVRGTSWTTTDRCDGTLIAVQQHSVLVTDLVKHKTILVRAGHRYLAMAPTRRHK